MAQMSTRDVENGNDASTEALSESRNSLSEWQTDPELKFYGRAMSSANSKRLAGQRLALEIYALVIIVIAAGIVVATYAFSFNRWHDGNGSPLKDQPHVNLGTPLSATDHLGDLAFRRYVSFSAMRPIAYLMLEAHWMYWTAGIGRFLLPETSTTLGDARPSLGRQRTIKHWLGLFGRRSMSEKALASQTSPRSPKTIPRVATP